MVDQHLREVLPLHIEPLGDGEGPVEGELHHVVPPDGALNIVVWIVVPDNEHNEVLKKDHFNPKILTKKSEIHLTAGNIRAVHWFGVECSENVEDIKG